MLGHLLGLVSTTDKDKKKKRGIADVARDRTNQALGLDIVEDVVDVVTDIVDFGD